ncbi:MAG: methyltransferase domain-containing protein [Dehalococcoidia bacterium]|jgi:SAM-dependent methyltransferase
MPEQAYSELLAAQGYARQATGWDLGFIDAAHIGPPLPWDYEAEAKDALQRAKSAVDLGTGGGEVLSRIAKAVRFARLTATEQWPPNARLAYDCLRPLGIATVWCEAEGTRTPFRPASFDLVLDRHEALNPEEVHRVLQPGGTLLTQQCTPDTWPELHRYFDRAARFPDHYRGYADALRALGYAVELDRHDFETRFASLSELVQMLIVAPWYVPDLDVEKDIEALRRLEAELSDGGSGIVLREGRYLLRAVKPGWRGNS